MHHRSGVLVSGSQQVIDTEKANAKAIDQHTPVHFRRGRVRCARKELEEQGHGEEAQSDDVVYVAGFAKIKA